MRKSNYLLWLLKAAGAGLVSLILLSAFAALYYNPAIHTRSESGATSYTRKPNASYSRWTEGFAWGKLDENGFNNAFPREENQNTDILLMGSSHMEALNVNQTKSTAYVLNEMFQENDNPLYTYNIGMSSHVFLRQAANLRKALETYQPEKYVILETYFSRSYTAEELEVSLENRLPALSTYETGLMFQLQKIPYFKLLYQQMKDYQKSRETAVPEKQEALDVQEDKEKQESLLNELISGIGKNAEEFGCKAIIFHYPTLSLKADGTVYMDQDIQSLETFAKVCEKNNVIFVDLTESFVENYNENHVLPTGFSNTPVGYGHLNETGHRLVAEKLYETILKDMEYREEERP